MEAKSNSKTEKSKKNIRHLLLEWSKKTTAHGIAGVTDAHHPILAIFWLIALLLSTAYCILTVVTALRSYYQFDTLVSVTRRADEPADFPAVTFCNLNPIDEMNLFVDWNVEVEILLRVHTPERVKCYFDSYINGSYFINLTYLDTCLNGSSRAYLNFGYENILRRYVANKYNDTKVHQYYGFHLEEMLLVCDYNTQPCSASDFIQFWHKDYGNCYTFNSGQNGSVIRQTNTAGPKFGLKLTLAVQPPKRLSYTSGRTGIYLLPHNQSMMQNMSMVSLDGGINIKAGAETYVGATRTFTYKQPAPYSDCIEDLKPFSDYSRKLFGYFADMNIGFYNQSTCLKLCYQDHLIEMCSCASTIINTLRNTKYCETFEETSCEFKYNHYFSKQSTNDFCEGVCRIECSRQTFQLTNSLASFPSDGALMFAMQMFLGQQRAFRLNLTGDYFDNLTVYNMDRISYLSYVDMTFLRVIVNYDDLLYTMISESPAITLDQLIGSIGGQFGLFIGISVLTFLEVFEVLVLILISLFKKEKIETVEPYKKQEKNREENANTNPVFVGSVDSLDVEKLKETA